MLTIVTFLISRGKGALVNTALFFSLVNRNTVKKRILIATGSLATNKVTINKCRLGTRVEFCTVSSFSFSLT